jgi:hypothetical protein
MSENTNDTEIKRLITQFNTLQTEYQTKLTAYISTKESYLQELQIVNGGNPCGSYSLLGTTTGISQNCYNQIWKDQKCTTTAPKVDSTKTFLQLLQDAFTKSTSSSDSNKKLCYGNAINPVINTSTTYLANSHDSDFKTQVNRSWVPSTSTSTSTSPTITSVSTNSVNDCLQMCAKTSGCTGATYEKSTTNPLSQICSLVNGPGKLTKPTSKTPPKTAIYLKLVDYSTQLKTLNNELLAKMDSLETIRSNIQSKLDIVNTDLLKIEGPLRSDYATLINEKQNLTDIINKYNDIEASYKENKQFSHDETGRLRLWSIIAVVAVLFIIKHFFGFDSPSINMFFWVTIFIVLGLSLNTPSGFAAMGILFLVFLILTINRFNN